MADFIETNPLTGFKISGIVAQTQFIPIELKKLRRSSLESALTRDKIDVIIQTDSKNVSEHYQIAQKHYLDFYQAPEFDGIMTTKHTIDIIDSVPLIHTHPTPLMGYGRIVKRIMDIIGGTAGIIIFWMSPNEKRYGDGWPMNGEIDIVETKGSDLDYAAADAHWGKSITNKTHKNSHKSDLPAGFSNTTDWHTYGVKWTEGKLEYFIDGKSYHTVEGFGQPNAANTPHGPFDVPFFLRLNMAIGGTYIDGPGGKWSNAYNVVAEEPGTFPATMSVDYVRIYQRRQPKEIEVKDTELRKLLNKKLGEKLGTTRTDNQKITDVELEKLTDLNLDNSNITDLTGIEAAKNLKNLSLNHNSISNLSPLSSLTSLKTLSLKENSITDISPLTGLTSLTSLHLEDQRANAKPNDKSFASPLKDLAGNVVSVTNSAEVINDTATPGNIQLLSLPASGASPILNTPWTRSITIGTVSTTFSGTLAIDTSAIPRAVQPQPQPQPGNPPAAAHNPANKPQNAVSGLLANTGFNAFLGVIATLALVAAGLFILR